MAFAFGGAGMVAAEGAAAIGLGLGEGTAVIGLGAGATCAAGLAVICAAGGVVSFVLNEHHLAKNGDNARLWKAACDNDHVTVGEVLDRGRCCVDWVNTGPYGVR